MIDYPITRAQLEAKVDAVSATWRTRAAARTAGFATSGKYDEKSSIWGEVKQVYMDVQGESKCAFCERKLESVDFGKIEQDVEHFRPKRKVEAWSVPTGLQGRGIAPTQPLATNVGYYLLAYDLLNYCASCAPCNSILKASFFPIDAAGHSFAGTDVAKLDKKEKPLLIFPLGKNIVKAQDLIGFTGVSPYARKSTTTYGGRRAFVTIEMFKLDDTARKNLILERCRIIIALLPQLELLGSLAPSPARNRAQDMINIATSPKSPHTNCATSFVSLYQNDPEAAARYSDEAFHYLNSSS
jgi:hypothetical protein